MTNTVVKIMVFSILLNFASGIMLTAVPEFENYMGGLWYNQKDFADFDTQIQGELNPDNQIQDSPDFFDRVLDTIGLGFINKWKEAINKYMFGFIDILSSVFSVFLGEALTAIIFTTLKSGVVILYSVFLFRMFTGKDVLE